MASTLMRAENRKGAVADVQRYLRHLSFETDTLSHVPVDGIYDSQTEEAVIAYQRNAGLPVTGEVDLVTWEHLQKTYDQSVAAGAEPARVPVFPLFPNGYVLDPGSGYYRILFLQFLLGEVSALYDTMRHLALDGVWGENTSSALRNFCEAEGLPFRPYVDTPTWNALVRAYTRLSADRQP